MPNPSSMHTNVHLTNFSKKLDNPMFIWEKVLPRLSVKKDEGKWPILGEERFKIFQTKIADKSPSEEVDWTYSSDTYECEEHGLHFAISPKDRRNVDSVINLQQDGIEDLNERINLSIEMEVASMLTSTSNITNYLDMDGDGTGDCDGKWDDPTNAQSHPLKALTYGIRAMWAKILRPPNALIIPFDAASYLAEHPDCEALMKEANARGLLESGELPPALKGMKVYYALGAYDSSKLGQTRSSFTSVWGKSVLLAYIAPQIGLKKLTLGFSPDVGGKEVHQWYNNERRCDMVELTEKGIDHVLVEANCGFLLTNVIS